MKMSFLCVFAYFFATESIAQLKLTKNVSWDDIDIGTVDNQGNLFITNHKGDLAKFSPDGQLMFEYSPMLNISVSQINANTQLKVLVFYEDLQSFTLLNRYLTSAVIYPLSNFQLGYVSTLTITPLQDIWVMDISDFSLKKLDILHDIVLETKSLSTLLQKEEANQAKLYAHQNRIYLSVPDKGLFVFDNIGNYLFKEDNLMTSLNFFKDELYYEKDGQLILRDINTNQERFLSVPDEKKKQMLFQNDQLYLLHSKGFSIYKYLRDFKTD